MPDAERDLTVTREVLSDQPPGAVLSIRDLHVEFPTDDGVVKAVDGLSYDVYPNEVLGIVGESGSGKSVSSLAILGLLPKRARITGQVLYRGQNLLALRDREMNVLRGAKIAMVFQDALAALNPVYSVGAQISEAIQVHNPKVGKGELRDRAIALLDLVGTPNPSKRVDQFPHEFSGGMRQRAMIAMALANDPDVLIADEPTTALDVTIQAQVLDVIERVQERTNSAIVLITHDLGVVAGVADRVMVMYAGRSAELASVDEIFYETRHPYTLGLLASLPRLDQDAEGMRLHRIKGQPPSLINVPTGCPFHPRCEFRKLPDPCATAIPEFRVIEADDHRSACHFAEELRTTKPGDLQPVAQV